MENLRVSPGDPISAAKWNALVDQSEAQAAILAGQGIRRRIIGGRIVLSATRPAPVRLPKTALQPYDASDSGGLRVGIRFGYVACYALKSPQKPWPTNFDDPETAFKFTFPVSETGHAWLVVSNSLTPFQQVDSISISHGADVPYATTTTGILPLASWLVETGGESPVLKILTEQGIGSQFYSYCNELHFFAPA